MNKTITEPNSYPQNYQGDLYTLPELLYYCYFAIMLTAKGFGLYGGQKLYTVSLIAGALLIVLKLVFTRHTLLEWVIIVLLGILGVCIYIHSDEMAILILIATVVGMKDVDVKRVMKLGCVIWTITFAISMLMALLGLRTDIFRAQEKLGLGHIIRWSLGQPHPNVLQIAFILLCAFILYLNKPKGKKLIIYTLIMFIGNVYIFIYSLSYTGMMLACFYLAFNLYLSFRKPGVLSGAETALGVILVPVCAAFSVLGPIVFTGKLWDICNKVLNTRFNIAKQYMGLNPVSLFGSGYCNELPPDLNNLDCSYVFALMHYGIIFFVIFFAAYVALIVYLIKKDRRSELGIVIALCVAAVSEPFFVNSSFKNISLVFLGEALYVFTAYIGSAASESLKEYKTFTLPTGKIEKMFSDIADCARRHVLQLVITGVAFGFAAVIIGAITVDMPSAYYMNRSHVQIISKGITLDIDNLPDDFDGEILEYTDSQTPMIRLDGNAVKLEYYRCLMSMGVWFTMLGAAGTIIFFYITDQNTKRAK